MFFVCLLAFLGAATWLPWWSTLIVCLGLTRLRALPGQQAAAAGLAWFMVAWLKDASAAGVISPRIAGLFSLPSIYAAYLMMAVIGAVTAFLAAQVYASFRLNASRNGS